MFIHYLCVYIEFFGGRIEKVLVKVGDYVKKDQVLITFPTDSPMRLSRGRRQVVRLASVLAMVMEPCTSTLVAAQRFIGPALQ